MCALARVRVRACWCVRVLARPITPPVLLVIRLVRNIHVLGDFGRCLNAQFSAQNVHTHMWGEKPTDEGIAVTSVRSPEEGAKGPVSLHGSCLWSETTHFLTIRGHAGSPVDFWGGGD